MITIVPEGGLCNRLRAVAAAKLLADRAECELLVHWYRTPDLNARFDHLFKTQTLSFRVSERPAMLGAIRSAVRLYERGLDRLGAGYIGNKGSIPDRFDSERVIDLARRRDVYIRSFAKFLSAPGMFDVFQPVAAIERRVDDLSPKLERAVGVHVRRTDNDKAIATSPLSAFFPHLDEAVTSNGDVQLFVATDAQTVTSELRGRYGDRVFEHPKASLRRDDPAAAVDAVVDLFALSRCQKLIGSYWSSFTDTAAELRGIERIIARADLSQKNWGPEAPS